MSYHLVSDALNAYCEEHSNAENDVLKDLTRYTNLHVLMPRMLSGHLQGRLLSMYSHLLKPKTILEIGTFTGYSALCLAEGLHKEGLLHTIDVNEELHEVVAEHVERAGLSKKIIQHIGDAAIIIPQIQGNFDLVFIDADKQNYQLYYDLVIGRMNKGGLIIADNVLWSAKVLEEKADKDTAALKAFNNFVQADPRVDNLLLPIRDGIMVCRVLG